MILIKKATISLEIRILSHLSLEILRLGPFFIIRRKRRTSRKQASFPKSKE
jgi:hypothetical protein